MRGLKQQYLQNIIAESQSHPARGAWIETDSQLEVPDFSESHPARGAWIETCVKRVASAKPCRTPPGVRGLKH